MFRHKFLNLVFSMMIISSFLFGGSGAVLAKGPMPPNGNGNGKGHGNGQMRSMTPAERKAARLNQAPQQTGVSLQFAGINSATAAFSPLASGLPTNALMAAPNSTPDYFGVANWANSPLPTIATDGTITGGMHKFIDPLPGLCNPGAAVGPIPACDPAVKSIPLAVPTKFAATTIAPASDYYEIALVQYREQMHSNLPAPGTLLRGYVQLVPQGTLGAIDLGTSASGADPLLPGYFAAAKPSYLGPIILAQGCEPTATACKTAPPTPVRVKFTNLLPSGPAGDLFIPTDTTYMGAGMGPTGQAYTQNRATLHLHGGNTPWISDGTPHQWTTPRGDTFAAYTRGDSVAFVPDMWFDASGNLDTNCVGSLTACQAGYNNDPGKGSLTFYWTNQQGGRLMFYHDHAYGVTRLNVYAGEAAGYLLSDPAEESALAAASVPGTVPADLGHLIPLVIQDKSFVPDNGATGGQLAATDPTWDLVKYGGTGNLWFPHVYMPNQNPADITGANAFGRWDYGPWFWPPQDPSTFVPQGQPFPCDSAAYPPGTSPAFPPLMCPGTPNPSGTPEGFMDTSLVNGTAYPTLTVDPTAYRFQILSAGNDRTLNLGLYKADPLTIAVTNGGSGYTAPPTVVFTPNTGTPAANAVISGGAVTAYNVTGVGSGYTDTSNLPVTIAGDGINAAAHAVISGGQVINVVPDNVGSGYSFATVAIPPPAGCTVGCLTATADAIVTPSGSVMAITVAAAGGPWTNGAPLISFTNAAGDTTGNGATAIASVNTEVKMVDALPPTPASTLKACGASNPISGSQLVTAILDAGGNPLNGTGLPPNCYPLTWPTDGRDGGVPDPTTAGPPFIEIASEGGLLPNPVVIPSTPVGYEYNRRSITVLNVWNHGLLLGPAERADVVVDFSKFRGQTLILYNDAPAPVPAFDPRSDYYTGDPDQTLAGGAPSTLPGYGPNTRTIMQIKVNDVAPSGNFSLPTLAGALPGIFASTQQTPIVPEPANNLATQATYVPLQDNTINAWLGVPVGSVKLTRVGAGYTVPPLVSFNPALGAINATATLKPTTVASVALATGGGGAGYTSVPLVTVSGGGGINANAIATMAPTSVASIAVSNVGRGYTAAWLVTHPITIDPPPCTPSPTCIQATVTWIVGNQGRLTITLVNHGAGYIMGSPLVPPVVNIPAPNCAPSNTCVRAVATTTLAPTSVASLTRGNAGSGYTDVPNVAVAAPTGCTLNTTTCVRATGNATLTPTSIASLTLNNGGGPYNAAPQVTIDAPTTCTINTTTCVQAAAVANASTPLLDKTIQELFTLDYGRMNATLGVELPFTNFLTQTTIPYGYIDPPTEIFKDGETQFWKITHNGVDTHFIHFHLFNVQVINRIGWDNAVKPPDPNEVGWKDTVRMNPLEIIVVALRPMQQNLPWPIGNSIRRLDVTQPLGSVLGFTNVDPTNQPAVVTNDLTNFGDEYVWHCHILGHEENDMMRAMILAVPPNGTLPTLAAGAPVGNGNQPRSVTLSWSDNSTNETGFIVQRAPSATGPWTTLATVATPGVFGRGYGSSVGGLPVTYTATGLNRGTTYYFQVIPTNTVGYTRTYAAPAVGYPHPSANALPSVPVQVVIP